MDKENQEDSLHVLLAEIENSAHFSTGKTKKSQKLNFLFKRYVCMYCILYT